MIFALVSLFLWSFLAATILPLGSELPLVVYVRGYNQIALPVLVATIGNYLGSCTTYWLARRVAQQFERTREMAKSEQSAARLLSRFGQPALLLSWVPIIGDVMVALAGAMRVPFARFSLWVALGKAARTSWWHGRQTRLNASRHSRRSEFSRSSQALSCRAALRVGLTTRGAQAPRETDRPILRPEVHVATYAASI